VRRPRRNLLLGLAAAAVVAVAGYALLHDGSDRLPPAIIAPGVADPFGYSPARRAEFERRATAGYSHVVYAKSPGGVVDTAARVEEWRPVVNRVAIENGFDPDILEAIVFLESAGRPEALADPKLAGAVGLTQILAGTATSLLNMHVDLAASRKLTKRILRADRREDFAASSRLRKRRAKVDERFAPRKSLAATGRYLSFARSKLARDDFAVAAYHMGVGNLQSVIADFRAAGGDPRSYAEVFFDTTPTRRPAAWDRLAALGDDSSTYLWRIYAARAIMRASRLDPDGLEETAELQTAKNSAEEVLHPEGGTTVFDEPSDIADAIDDGELRPFPNLPGQLGLRRDRNMGELAPKLDAERSLYRALRPEAYALAAYASLLTRREGGGTAALTVTSTVRDRRYQRLLIGRNPEATQRYSLHTTGYAFDVLRRYRTRAQARAFQFALDRLQALNLIAWVREPAAIHVTASSDARRLVRLLKRP
jgi:soluble lytic murein transglycosylase-like protein